MSTYLASTAAQLHRDDLLREARHAKLVAEFREPHAWRNRMGAALIRAGRFLADDPPPPPAPSRHPRARVA
jgi:hypothetical protein